MKFCRWSSAFTCWRNVLLYSITYAVDFILYYQCALHPGVVSMMVYCECDETLLSNLGMLDCLIDMKRQK